MTNEEMMIQSGRIINKDYIGAIKKVNGKLEYIEFNIPDHKELIMTLDEMRRNPVLNRLDIQNTFLEEFRDDDVSSLNYIYPNEYNSSYVDYVDYPRIYSAEDYGLLLNKKEAELIREHFEHLPNRNSLSFLKYRNEERYQKAIEYCKQQVQEGLNDYIHELRKGFCYRRYIHASDYYCKLKQIGVLPGVVMWSTEQIGWKAFNYKITENLEVQLNTNFGYGSSSYFLCNLLYKGIKLLPFSDVIRYYGVDWIEFRRHTRKYKVVRESWAEVLKLITEVGNMVISSPEEFETNWIVNEIGKMMQGLRTIKREPSKAIQHHIRQQKEKKYVQVYENISDDEIRTFKIYEEEFAIAYKAEKISGCLLFLKRLQELSALYPAISDYVQEIEELNRQVMPEISQHILRLKEEIKVIQEKHFSISKDIAKSETILFANEKSIEALMGNRIVMPDVDLDIATNLAILQRENLNVRTEVKKLKIKEEELKQELFLRKDFLIRLKTYRRRIKDYINYD